MGPYAHFQGRVQEQAALNSEGEAVAYLNVGELRRRPVEEEAVQGWFQGDRGVSSFVARRPVAHYYCERFVHDVRGPRQALEGVAYDVCARRDHIYYRAEREVSIR